MNQEPYIGQAINFRRTCDWCFRGMDEADQVPQDMMRPVMGSDEDTQLILCKWCAERLTRATNGA